jgi:hypothetical protein
MMIASMLCGSSQNGERNAPSGALSVKQMALRFHALD